MPAVLRNFFKVIYRHCLNLFFSSDPRLIKQLKLRNRIQAVWVAEGLGRRVATRLFEVDETKYLFSQIKPGNICLDVGANVGYYTQMLASLVGGNGKVVAVEPIPRNADLIKFNRHQNFASEIITVFECAVGSEDKKTVEFLVANVNSSLSTVKSNDDKIFRSYVADVEVAQTRNVLCRTLDSIVEEMKLEEIDFLKIDVEGFEFHAFTGFEKTLSNTQKKPKLIMVELSSEQLSQFGHSIEDVSQFLKKFGYTANRLNRGILCDCTKADMEKEQNIFFSVIN